MRTTSLGTLIAIFTQLKIQEMNTYSYFFFALTNVKHLSAKATALMDKNRLGINSNILSTH